MPGVGGQRADTEGATTDTEGATTDDCLFRRDMHTLLAGGGTWLKREAETGGKMRDKPERQGADNEGK